MKIYNRIVIDMTTLKTIEEDSFEYDGPVALCGGGGGSKTQTNTVMEKSDPWGPQQPYLTYGMEQAKKLYQGDRAITGYTTTKTLNPAWENYQKYGDVGLIQASYNLDGSPNFSSLQGDYSWLNGSSPPSQYIETQTPIYGDYIEGGPLKYYPGDAVADLNTQQLETINALYKRGTEGYQPQKAGEGWINDVLGGKYLNDSYFKPGFNPNPYLHDIYNKAWADTQGVLNANASRYGAYGGSDYDNYRATTAGNMATDLYGKAYDADQARYLQYVLANQGLMKDAASMVPAYAAMDYNDLQARGMAGDLLQAQNQREIDALKAKWDFQQMEPWQRLEMYGNAISGNLGSEGSKTETIKGQLGASGTQQFAGAATGALGGAAAGAAVGAKIGSGYPGVGTAIGAVVGGLAGWLGNKS